MMKVINLVYKARMIVTKVPSQTGNHPDIIHHVRNNRRTQFYQKMISASLLKAKLQ